MLYRCKECRHAKSIDVDDGVFQCKKCGGEMVPYTLKDCLQEARTCESHEPKDKD